MRALQRLMTVFLCAAAITATLCPWQDSAFSLAPRSRVSELSPAIVAAHFLKIEENDPEPIVYTKDGKIIGRAKRIERKTLLALYEIHGPFHVNNLGVTDKGWLTVAKTQRFHFAQYNNARASVEIGNSAIVTRIYLTPIGSNDIVAILPRVMKKGDRLLASALEVQHDKLKELYDEHGAFELTQMFVSADKDEAELAFAGARYGFKDYPGAEAAADIGENGFPTRIRLRPANTKGEVSIPLYLLEKDGHCIGSARQITETLLKKTQAEHGDFWVDRGVVPSSGFVTFTERQHFNFEAFVAASLRVHVGAGAWATQIRYKPAGQTQWRTRRVIRTMQQKLKSMRFVHIDGFKNPVLQLAQSEKEPITVEVQWIYEFGKWVPDRVLFPQDAVNAGRQYGLKRIYDAKGNITQIANQIRAEAFQEGGFVSLRTDGASTVHLGTRNIYKLDQSLANELIHVAIGSKGIPTKLIAMPDITEEQTFPLMLYEKHGQLLGSASRLNAGELATLHVRCGDFQINHLKVSNAGEVSLGEEGHEFLFGAYADGEAKVAIGSNGYATRIWLRKKDQKRWHVFHPLLLKKEGVLIGSSMKFARKTLARKYTEHGQFWVTGLRVMPSGKLNIAGHSFAFPNHRGARVEVLIGENGIPVKVKFARTRATPPATYALVLVEKNGIPLRAFRSALNFSPKVYGESVLRCIPIPYYGVLTAAGELYRLHEHAGKSANIHYDAQGRAQTVEVSDDAGQVIARYKAEDVLHKQIADWEQWPEAMQDRVDRHLGLVHYVVNKYVSWNAPRYLEIVEAGMRGLRVAIQRYAGSGENIPSLFLFLHIRRAVLDGLNPITPEIPLEEEFLSEIGGMAREDELDTIDREHTRREVDKALDRLPPQERALVIMLCYEGMSVEQAVEELNLPQESIVRMYEGATQKLRESLQLFKAYDIRGAVPPEPSSEPHIAAAGPTPRETEIGRKTRFTTYATRLRRLDSFLVSRRFQTSYGFAWAQGGIATAEIGTAFPPGAAQRWAKHLAEIAPAQSPNMVLGIDTEIPAQVLKINPTSALQNPMAPEALQTFVLFDQQGNVMDATYGRHSLSFAMKDRPEEYRQFAAKAREIKAQMMRQRQLSFAGMKLFDFAKHYGAANLQLMQGSMSCIPAPDESLSLVRAMNVFVHYGKEEQRRALKHIQRKLQDGGVFVEGSMDPYKGDAVIYQKQQGKLVPKEILFLNWQRLELYLNDTEHVLHRPLPFQKAQRGLLRRTMNYMNNLSKKRHYPLPRQIQSLVQHLNKAGFVATISDDGMGFSLALVSDLSPAMSADVIEPKNPVAQAELEKSA